MHLKLEVTDSQAIKDIRESQNVLVDLFGPMKFFFKRLEVYIEVRPTTTVTDIVVRVAVEVLSILRIVTKEIRQERISTSSPVGISTIINLMQRIFFSRNWAEGGMSRARCSDLPIDSRGGSHGGSKLTRGIDDKVKGVDHKVG